MDSTMHFIATLGLHEFLRVSEIRFKPEQGEIHFDLSCEVKRLECPACSAAEQPIHDRDSAHRAASVFLSVQSLPAAPLSRLRCGHCGKVTQVAVPWVRPGSGFTLLMDALVLTLAKRLPVSAITQMFGVSENRIRRVIKIHVESARETVSHAEVQTLGVDENLVGRRLGYLTLSYDPIARRVIGTVDGRKAETFKTLREDLVPHEGRPESIRLILQRFFRGFELDQGALARWLVRRVPRATGPGDWPWIPERDIRRPRRAGVGSPGARSSGTGFAKINRLRYPATCGEWGGFEMAILLS